MADLERIRTTHEPSTIFLEGWFIEHVLLNPQLAGAMRSLLGPAIGLPILASHHRVECPEEPQGWHQDADHIFGPELRFLEVFYFPQDTPLEMGPTELVPGSHIQPTTRDNAEGGVFCDGPAGTIAAAAHPPPRVSAACSNTIIGAPRRRRATGSSKTTSTSKRPITAATPPRATTRICSIGYAARGANIVLPEARVGHGHQPTKSDLHTAMLQKRVICPTGARTIATATPTKSGFNRSPQILSGDSTLYFYACHYRTTESLHALLL